MALITLQEFPIYKAIAHYQPIEPEGLVLEEGDLIEVLDAENPEKWLCQLAEGERVQGWVPPSYIIPRAQIKLDTRTTQQVFREDIIQIKNKQQEAVMKRR